MRLRVCIMLACAIGAAGSLILAADMYRRLSVAERLALEGFSAAGNANLVFGMTHVLGTAGLGLIFLAVCLLLVNERKPAPSATEPASAEAPAAIEAVPLGVYAEPAPRTLDAPVEDAPVAPSGTDKTSVALEPAPLAFTVQKPPTRVIRPSGPIPSPPPKPSTQFPAAPELQRPSRNIFVVQATPAPPPRDCEPPGVSEPVSASEFQRAVVEEEVIRAQGEIPTATPVTESGLQEGVKEEKPGADSSQ
jgi:hypothetical protein